MHGSGSDSATFAIPTVSTSPSSFASSPGARLVRNPRGTANWNVRKAGAWSRGHPHCGQVASAGSASLVWVKWQRSQRAIQRRPASGSFSEGSQRPLRYKSGAVNPMARWILFVLRSVPTPARIPSRLARGPVRWWRASRLSAGGTGAGSATASRTLGGQCPLRAARRVPSR